ncbi:hypothetical protein [Amycolatopsis sp. lyj-109]|uniref:hypothetical protein n=1 Tax=Amycolatopsis sp. lyj-109 TaxID=2789287 RepID=UPI0039797C94
MSARRQRVISGYPLPTRSTAVYSASIAAATSAAAASGIAVEAWSSTSNRAGDLPHERLAFPTGKNRS